MRAACDWCSRQLPLDALTGGLCRSCAIQVQRWEDRERRKELANRPVHVGRLIDDWHDKNESRRRMRAFRARQRDAQQA